MVICKDCTEPVRYEQAEEHNRSCAGVEIPCPGQLFGCEVSIRRGAMHEHKSDCTLAKVAATFNDMKVQVNTLQQRVVSLESELREANNRLAHQRASDSTASSADPDSAESSESSSSTGHATLEEAASVDPVFRQIFDMFMNTNDRIGNVGRLNGVDLDTRLDIINNDVNHAHMFIQDNHVLRNRQMLEHEAAITRMSRQIELLTNARAQQNQARNQGAGGTHGTWYGNSHGSGGVPVPNMNGGGGDTSASYGGVGMARRRSSSSSGSGGDVPKL